MHSFKMGCVIAVVALAACGKSTAPKSEPPPVKETVFGDMVGTMDRAKSVQDTVMRDKEKLDAAVEANERSESKKDE